MSQANTTNPVRIARTVGGYFITVERDAVGPRGEGATVTTKHFVQCTPEQWAAAVADLAARSEAPRAPTHHELVEHARRVLTLVRSMDRAALDDWYESNVGYRLSEDDPELAGAVGRHRTMVGDMMLRHELEGHGVPEAVLDDLGRMLGLAINHPPAVLGEFELSLIDDARRRDWIL